MEDCNSLPHLKKGPKSSPANYRPVSLTSIASKIMESFIREHILNHLIVNNQLSKKQFGFLKGRSTMLQLVKVLDEWIDLLEVQTNKGIDTVYMDFQKAFDKVPHRRLLLKMQSYGLGTTLVNWVKDFLSNRKHCVNVNGTKSDWSNVSSGIPQGTVLGPTLFVLYINDMPDDIISQVYLFADDTKVFSPISKNTPPDILQEDLNRLTQWSEKWLLLFHPEKCKVLRIGNRTDPPYDYTINTTKLEHVRDEKDLGVIIDNSLKFQEHINNKVNKANSIMGAIRRSFKYLDAESFKKIYKGIVRPHLEYAVPVWAPHYKKDIRTIEGVQRRATKLINGFKDKCYSDRLRELRMPTLVYRRQRGDMIQTFKLLTGKYDRDVSDFLPVLPQPENSRRTRGHSLKLTKKRATKDVSKFSFTRRVVNIWNSLPESVISATSLNAFENRLDRYWSRQSILYDFEASLDLQKRPVPDEEVTCRDEDLDVGVRSN